MPEEEITTIEDLARAVKKGFDATATKADVRTLRDDLVKVNKRLDAIDEKLGKIEDTILEDYGQRIKRIEEAIGLARAPRAA